MRMLSEEIILMLLLPDLLFALISMSAKLVILLSLSFSFSLAFSSTNVDKDKEYHQLGR